MTDSQGTMDAICVTAPLWRWQSPTSGGGWYFITIDGDAGDQIRVAAMMSQWLDGRRGFGSAKVSATIGGTCWQTSVFPDKQSGGWLLPVKAGVRKAEALAEGQEVTVTVSL